MTTIQQAETTFLWLEITGKCQLDCRHCYADSGPSGTHGTMTTDDWRRVIDQASALGVRMVQFIGGEPTLHAGLAQLVRRAVSREMKVEVFSNLVHVTDEQWTVFGLPGVSLATSYYSDDPTQHAEITGRPTHARTNANIVEARRRGIPLRAGVIEVMGGQRTDRARAELRKLGVSRIGSDRQRQIGRAACSDSRADQLCGRCGDGAAAVRPDGSVSPCVMARWMTTGSVHAETPAEATAAISTARAELINQGMPQAAANCKPSENCYPQNCDPYF